MGLYQSLVTVNPVTLIAQICNLFLQLFFMKIFFLDKVKAILDQRREAANREIGDAQTAREDALRLKAAYEEDLRLANVKAEQLLISAQQSAAAQADALIRSAQHTSQQIRLDSEAQIAAEKKKALQEAKNEISEIAVVIAARVVGRELTAADHTRLIDGFLNELENEL